MPTRARAVPSPRPARRPRTADLGAADPASAPAAEPSPSPVGPSRRCAGSDAVLGPHLAESRGRRVAALNPAASGPLVRFVALGPVALRGAMGDVPAPLVVDSESRSSCPKYCSASRKRPCWKDSRAARRFCCSTPAWNRRSASWSCASTDRVEPARLPPEGGDVRDQHLVAQPRHGHLQRLQPGQLPRPAGVRDRGLRRQPGQPQPVHDVRRCAAARCWPAPRTDGSARGRCAGTGASRRRAGRSARRSGRRRDRRSPRTPGSRAAPLHRLLQFRVAPTDAAGHATPSRARSHRPAHRTARTARSPSQTWPRPEHDRRSAGVQPSPVRTLSPWRVAAIRGVASAARSIVAR